MKQKIKVAVIGGTGKSGKYLVKELIKQNFSFKILVRNPERFSIQNPSIEVVMGDVKDYETVRQLVDGCEAIISTLGLGLPPSETSIFSQSTKNVLRAMKECNIQRFIVTTGLNVDTPKDKKSPKVKAATDWMKTNYPKTTTDKQLEYDILVTSSVDWTLARLPMIEQTDECGKLLVNLEDCPGDKISATDLANFLIEQLYDDSYLKKAPFIASV